MQSRNLVYILTCLSFSVICGAAVYEHVAVWPKAFAKLPASLSSFQGEHAFNNGIFWMMIHPITLVLFIIATIMHWKTDRKKHLLYPLIAYAVVLVVTSVYFVPELLSILGTAYSNTYDASLTARGSQWELLSIIRAVLLFATAVFLYLGLTKPATRNVAG
ncbi:MAG: hypothetical protein K0Q66_4 [Chitinophagaceae bacterium]|jgi:hypothetical protein|nr:hypothetical protein [Chitinophagaceae bacterium]